MDILIIEGNPDDARLAESYIRQGLGSEVESLTIEETLEKALGRLREKPYTVLLTDLVLPDANGVEIYRRIAEVDPSLPVVILSANDDEKEAAALVGQGAQDYLSKSDFNERIMKRSLLYAIERKALEVKLHEKNRDLEAAQDELIHAAKMESTGHLAAGVAHEVKNPLAVIQLGLDTISAVHESEDNPNELVTKCLSRIQKALDRADRIIHELLDFSSEPDLHWELDSINDVYEKAISLINPQLRKSSVILEECLLKDLPPIRIDRRKLEQAFINLIVNAEHAMEGIEDKRIRFTTAVVRGVESGEKRALIRVEDSGPGVEVEDLSKVFDAFYTTKDPDKGTGLGMTVVQMIVQQHNGRINLSRSDELGGLAVEIRIPLITEM